MSAIIWLIYTILEIAFFIVIAHVIMSWLINFNVVDVRHSVVGSIWNGLQRLTEPLYRPIRQILPDLGGIDLAPLVVILAILFLQRLIVGDLAPMLI